MRRVLNIAIGMAAACALAAPASAQFGGLGGFKKAIEKAKEVPKPETKEPEQPGNGTSIESPAVNANVTDVEPSEEQIERELDAELKSVVWPIPTGSVKDRRPGPRYLKGAH